MFRFCALVLLLAGSDPVTHVPAGDVAAALEKSEAVPAVAALAKAENYSVITVRRTKAGESELHLTDNDIFYVMDGSATFTTGGEIVGRRTTAPNEIRGTGIRDGNSRRIAKGDVLTIPAGTPHWFSEVHGSVTYLVIKVATKSK